MGLAKSCDVYGTTKGVETYHIQILRCDASGMPLEDDSAPVLTASADLGPRGLKRLGDFVERGTKPCGWEAEHAGLPAGGN